MRFDLKAKTPRLSRLLAGRCSPRTIRAAVFKPKAKAMAFLRTDVANGMILNADVTSSWDELYKRYKVKCINHTIAVRGMASK